MSERESTTILFTLRRGKPNKERWQRLIGLKKRNLVIKAILLGETRPRTPKKIGH